MEIKYWTKKVILKRGAMGMEYTKYSTRCPHRRINKYGMPVFVGDISCRKCVRNQGINEAEAVCICDG